MKKSIKTIFAECEIAETLGMTATDIYFNMSDEDRNRLIKGLCTGAAVRTGAKMENPVKMFLLVRENLDDITQSANCRFLEAMSENKIYSKDGEKLPFKRLIARACNASVTHAWREIYSHPTAEIDFTDKDGKEFSVIDLDGGAEIKRPTAPEAAIMAEELIKEVLNCVKPVYRNDAEKALRLKVLYGYNMTEIAKMLNCTYIRVRHIFQDVAETPKRYAERLNDWTDAPLREVIEALRELFEN